MTTSKGLYRHIVFAVTAIFLLVTPAIVDQLCSKAQAVTPPSKWKKSASPSTPTPVTEEGGTSASQSESAAKTLPPESNPRTPLTDKEFRKALGDIQRQLIDIEKKERDMMDKLSVLEAAGEGEGEKARGLKADIYDLKERRQTLLKQKMDLTSGWFKRATPPPSVPVEPIEAPPAPPAAAPAPPATAPVPPTAVPAPTTVAPAAAPEVGAPARQASPGEAGGPRLSTIPYVEAAPSTAKPPPPAVSPAPPAVAPAPPAAAPAPPVITPTPPVAVPSPPVAPQAGTPRISTIPYAETPSPKVAPSAKTPPSTVYPGPAVTPGWKSDLPAGWEKPEELPPGAVPLEKVKTPYDAGKRLETPVTPVTPLSPVMPVKPVTPARPAVAPTPTPPVSVPEEVEEIGPTEEVEEKVSPPSRWE